MATGVHVVEQWRGGPAAGTIAPEAAAAPMIETFAFDPAEPDATPRWPARIAVGLLAVLALAWIGLFAWRAALAVSGGMPPFSTLLIGAATLSAPLALIGIAYLLLRRTSRREARRFGETAAAMRAQAAALEQTLATLSARIEQSREVLGDHARQLLELGDDATLRLGAISGAMRVHGDELAERTRLLEQAAAGAGTDMGVLLQDLPRAAAQSRELGALLKEAGLGAHEQTGALESALAALGQTGRTAEESAGGAAERLAAHVARIEIASIQAGERLEVAAGEMTGAVDGAMAHAARSIDEARRAIEAQASAMLAMIEQGRVALERTGDESARALSDRLDQLDARLARMAEQLERSDVSGSALVGKLDAGLVGIEQRFETLSETGTAKTDALGEAIATLGARAGTIDVALERGTQAADTLIARAETLVGLLRQNGAEIGEALPHALGELERRIDESRAALGALVPQAAKLAGSASEATTMLGSADALLLRQAATMRALGAAAEERLATIEQHADRVTNAIADSGEQARQLIDRAAPELVDALLRVRETAQAAADHAREALSAVIPETARALGDAAHTALERALDAQIETQMTQVTTAGENAVTATHRATERLMRQMLSIADTTAVIEARLAEARAETAQSDEDSLSRRVALLIDSLNSSAIDVAGILSQEVTDTAWAGYLRGDRGIFTRRSVRLLDGTQIREIQRLYARDPAFHDQLNRYVHDFESMLRRVLASRDGSSLGITLLSSDVGKLYVALAQAIDRLRT